jgi:hypothetical protein
MTILRLIDGSEEVNDVTGKLVLWRLIGDVRRSH